MVVQHNLKAMNANRMLGITQGKLSGATEKLSSGYKINRAADNAAGLSISEKMRKQIRGLDQASTNAEDGISCVQTAEGALAEVTDMLQRLNELAVQSANGTNSSSDRSYIQDEVNQLVTEIDRVAETTKFNETYLLKGDAQATKGYSFSYGKAAQDTVATATMTTDTATSLTAAVDFTNTETSVANQNDLAKALRDQGMTVTTTFSKSANSGAGETVYKVELNGAAADNFKVVTTDAAAGTFEIQDKDGNLVAEVTASGSTVTDASKFAESAVITADTVTAAASTQEVYSFYDKEGNAIAANALDKYFTGDGTTANARADAPAVYDALGNEVALDNDDASVVCVQNKVAALGMKFHVGADATSNNQISVNIEAMSSKTLGLNGLKVDGDDATNALKAISTVAEALQKVSEQRSALGAVQNRLDHTIKNLDNIVENTTAAESGIRDTDMAETMVEYSNTNILAQAGQSMLAQANQSNQGVLSILG